MPVQETAGVLYGCKRLDITPLNVDGSPNPSADTFAIDVPQEASIEPQITEGNKAELRGGDNIIATIEDEDVLTGLNLTFTNAELRPDEVRAIAGNGEIIFDASGNAVGYKAPTMKQQQSEKVPFKAELYVSLYEQGSQSKSSKLGYIRFTFPYCKGSIPNLTASDQEFLTPEFTLKARENRVQNLSVMQWEQVPDLPT
ncbi:hypothetical protein U472_00475 [Orenia metallireducens]|jgi:hypothetical protein|uniref:Phage tail protein n=1 Tax=Orenia metallireducens TaxID=1413210 RepID=A0A1C0ADC5_9FIRM|nr:hypothetical protein [Orenia metallireducens]OCL28664.1 hypothetical protein U472_00475 [Orenia metallireducens]